MARVLALRLNLGHKVIVLCPIFSIFYADGDTSAEDHLCKRIHLMPHFWLESPRFRMALVL